MKKKFLLSGLIIFFLAGISDAASLWNDKANWFADERPGKVGDIVTVIVNERTDAKDEATMEITKQTNNEVADGSGILKFLRAITFQSNNSSTGDGSVERKHHATATVACLITEVLPNGNLVIEGTRDIRTSEETLQFQLIGVIRPQDVTSENKISSQLVANAEIAVKGRGIVSRTQKPGIITQILQAVF